MPSRSAKISLLLAVDVVFFFIELTAGYAVGSLALVADSFHMLNDVLSLIVGLYAIKLSKNEASPRYSYGWHRAEIVAALINGVFLLALCLSIFLEAVKRFFSAPEITNEKLIVMIGSLALISNFLGLFLFHEHSHVDTKTLSKTKVDQNIPSLPIPIPANKMAAPQDRSPHDSFTDLYGHPAATRASVVQAAQDIGYGKSGSSTQHKGYIIIDNDGSPTSSLAPEQANRNDGMSSQRLETNLIDIAEGSSTGSRNDEPQDLEDGQNVRERHGVTTKGAHSGSHGSMNMHALILHVVGDALGNVGVIATGLIMWLSTWEYKYYLDPVISLVLTAIIFSSALPLVCSASFILLQAVPSTISLEEIRKDIEQVPGVTSVHELHVWQLSEDKIVASVHVLVSRNEYMEVARVIRKILHDHGVHSSTIQPEYTPEELSTTNPETGCLIPCPPNELCKPENACCPPITPVPIARGSPPLIEV